MPPADYGTFDVARGVASLYGKSWPRSTKEEAYTQNFIVMGHIFLSRYCNPLSCLRSRPISDVKQRDMNIYDTACRKNRNLVVAFCKTSYSVAENRLKPYVLCAVFFLLVNANRPSGIALPFPRAVTGNVLSSYRIIRVKCAEHNTRVTQTFVQ